MCIRDRSSERRMLRRNLQITWMRLAGPHMLPTCCGVPPPGPVCVVVFLKCPKRAIRFPTFSPVPVRGHFPLPSSRS
eukprot:12045682-Alexandrium_andersonii.AAC.1